MNSARYSLLSCVVNTSLSQRVNDCLESLALPAIHIQRGKQLCLEEKAWFPGLPARVRLAEDRADIYRFLLPSAYEASVAAYLAESADLLLPGRGSLYAEDVGYNGWQAPCFDDDRLSALGGSKAGSQETWSLVCCIVQRGRAGELAETILDMGLCVPVISFGEGMGLRSRLGLLRITIPVDKEILYLLVPQREAELVEGVLFHKARLSIPGMGFIYRSTIRVHALNVQISRGRRSHMASMDQIISALDELRGSSEWRRFSGTGRPAMRHKPGGVQAAPVSPWVCLSIVAEEGQAATYAKVAMDKGAGGATLFPLQYADYSPAGKDGRPARGHAWETCDLVFKRELLPGILDGMVELGLEQPGSDSSIRVSAVDKIVAYR